MYKIGMTRQKKMSCKRWFSFW